MIAERDCQKPQQLKQSSARSKLEQLKQLVVETETSAPSKPITLQINSCQHGKCCNGGCNSGSSKLLQAPIILEKRTPRTAKHTNKTKFDFEFAAVRSPRGTTTIQARGVRKEVEQFTPIDIPKKKSTAAFSSEYLPIPQTRTKQIEVRIEKDDKDDRDKDCLKKLFKKINKLTDELNASQKERARLQLELNNYKDLQNRQREYQRKMRELELAKHKLDLQVATLKELLAMEKLKPPIIVEKIVERPVEVIKQVPIERIVEVQVEVAKLIPGPERIIEKFVEVPKYIEVERKVPMEIIKEVTKEVPKEVVRTVQVPEYLEKPVYIQKPVYIDRVIEKKVEVPIEVPIETPVYVNRPQPIGQPAGPGINQYDYYSKVQRLASVEDEMRAITHENESLRSENRQLLRTLEILKKHNEDKNREVEQLIMSTHDHTALTKGALGGMAFRPSFQQQAYRHEEEVYYRPA